MMAVILDRPALNQKELRKRNYFSLRNETKRISPF